MKITYLLLALIAPSVSLGIEINWNGCSSPYWSHVDNWTPYQLPTDKDTVIIAGTKEAILLETADETIAKLHLKYGEMILGKTLTVKDGADSLVVGWDNGKTGQLTINNGGTLIATSAKNFHIGIYAGQEGKVTLNEGGRIELKSNGYSGRNDGRILVGSNGTGTLDVNGGSILCNSLNAGNNVNGDGTINVYGGLIETKYAMHIGNTNSATPFNPDQSPIGRLNVYGGKINATGSGGATIGNQQYSRGIANVYGGEYGGTSLYIGWQTAAQGDLYIHDGGIVSFTSVSLAGSYQFGYNVTDPDYQTRGTIHFQGGTLQANTITLGYYGTALIDISSSSVTLQRKSGTGAVAITTNNNAQSGTLRFSYDTGSFATDAKLAGNKLTVEHTGAGTTTLSGDSSYGGGTHLNNGLVIAASNKALGNGTLYIKGGVFRMQQNNTTLATGGIELTTGQIDLANGQVDQVSLTGAFNMTGGSYTIDILGTASDAFDQMIGTNGTLNLAGGTLVLSGFNGFEAGESGIGGSYAIFTGFAELPNEIIDGIGGFVINGYDKEHWTAHISKNGTLYFSALPIPETSSALLLVCGLLGAGVRRNRRAA